MSYEDIPTDVYNALSNSARAIVREEGGDFWTTRERLLSGYRRTIAEATATPTKKREVTTEEIRPRQARTSASGLPDESGYGADLDRMMLHQECSGGIVCDGPVMSFGVRKGSKGGSSGPAPLASLPPNPALDRAMGLAPSENGRAEFDGPRLVLK